MQMTGLLDCNNFYASCEQVFDPRIEGRPVGVLSNNDGSCIARSKELKALNFPKRLAYYMIREQTKKMGIIFRSSNYPLYGDMSRRVMSILADMAPRVEQYSIDESFFYANLSTDADWFGYGSDIRKRILKWTGIPCGVGLAKTKTLAKIANHIGKKRPEGVFVMPKDNRDILASLPTDEVWGVGWRLAARLRALGIRTAWDLANRDANFIRKKFSVILAQTVLELQGQPAISFNGGYHKQLAFARSFREPLCDFNAVREAVFHYTANIGRKLRSEEVRSACGMIYMDYVPEHTPRELPGGYTSQLVTFREPTADSIAISQQLTAALPQLFVPGRRCLRVGVILFGFEPMTQFQSGLFADTSRNLLGEQVCAVMDKVNEKFGRGAMFSLAEGIKRPWSMKQELLSRRYTTSWKELVTAK